MKRLVKALLKKAGSGSFAVFAREIFANPRSMGAACPSTPSLASCMAAQVPLDREGWVIELGGGTGSVTAALLKHGISPHKLLVIEQSATLANHLRQRFPQLRVIQGDAAQLEHLIGRTTQPINCMVSSLPLRSLHPTVTRAIRHQFETMIGAGGLLIQFTYDLRGTRTRSLPRFRRLSSRIVWSNLPPARVDVFEREHGSGR